MPAVMEMSKKKPGPKPDPARVRDAITIVRSRVAWKQYLERLADFDRASSVSELIDRAVVVYARHVGFEEMPPKR